MSKVMPSGWWVQSMSQPKTTSSVIPQTDTCDWTDYCFRKGGGCGYGDTQLIAGHCVIRPENAPNGCTPWKAKACADC